MGDQQYLRLAARQSLPEGCSRLDDQPLVRVERDGPVRTGLRGNLEREIARGREVVPPREFPHQQLVARHLARHGERVVRRAGVDDDASIDVVDRRGQRAADDVGIAAGERGRGNHGVGGLLPMQGPAC